MASFFETSAGLAIGYVSGGAVTQLTSKATGVTVNAPSGAITTDDASLAGNAEVTFTVTNSSVTLVTWFWSASSLARAQGSIWRLCPPLLQEVSMSHSQTSVQPLVRPWSLTLQ